MSVFDARLYKKAHRHGPGRVIVIPVGEGYSIPNPIGISGLGDTEDTVFTALGPVLPLQSPPPLLLPLANAMGVAAVLSLAGAVTGLALPARRQLISTNEKEPRDDQLPGRVAGVQDCA